ncbi:MAG: hypothetical protein WCK09_15335 [Bacteroidota bacterium]
MIFFHHTTIVVPASGDIVRFSDKLPGKAKICQGVYLSADTHHATKALANVSLSFNEGKEQVINQVLTVKSTMATRADMLNIMQSIDSNQRLKGFIKDLGNAPAYPYTVKVYYQLKS